MSDELIKGCISPEAKEMIGSMISRRMVELVEEDPTGGLSEDYQRLQSELNGLSNCMGAGAVSNDTPSGTADEFVQACMDGQIPDVKIPVNEKEHIKIKMCRAYWDESED
jgi:hypothetical protein